MVVLDFSLGGGRLNNNSLFFLLGSEIGTDLSSSRSVMKDSYCCCPISSAWKREGATVGSMMSLVSIRSRSLLSSRNGQSHFFHHLNEPFDVLSKHHLGARGLLVSLWPSSCAFHEWLLQIQLSSLPLLAQPPSSVTSASGFGVPQGLE